MNFLNFLQFCYDASISFALDNGQLKVNAPQGTLTPDIVQRLRQFKPELLEFLQTSAANERAPAQQFQHILPVERSEYLPVSYGQEQLWLALQKDDVGDAYHFVRVLELVGELDPDALNATFTAIFQRHEALRTVFVARDELLLQTILAAPEVDIPVTDLRTLDQPQRGEAANALHQQLARAPFDLTCDLMLRLHLIRIDQHRYQLVIVLHHIASDGWSLGILVNEFQALYTRLVQGGVQSPMPLLPLPIQYADYAHWQRAPHQLAALASSLEYWTKCLAGAPELHSLPTDYPRPAHQSFKGNRVYTRLDAATTDALRQLAQRAGCTLFMVLETLFAGLIARYSGSSDVVIGTPVANRPHQDVEGLIGYFVNMLALRHQIDDSASTLQLLGQAKQDIVAAFSHEHVPFAQVVRALTTTRSTSYSPVIQIAFVLQNNDIADLSLPGVACTIRQPGNANVPFDLTLEASETGAELQLCWKYASDLFEQATLERMARAFGQLVHSALADPDMPLNRLPLISDQERHQLLVEWNDTATPYPSDKCIHELFEEQAEQNPDAVAVVYEGEQLSYGELNARANQLAHYLVTEKKVKPDTFVGICVERSLEMVIGILAILKAGGAYVPLDPDYPPARLAYVLDDAKLATVVTHSRVQKNNVIPEQKALNQDHPGVRSKIQQYSSINLPKAGLGLSSKNLAYVIYTSGSTGNAKGVMVEHHSAVNFWAILGNVTHQTCQPQAKIGLNASFTFDMSLKGILQLLSGHTLVIIPQTIRADGNAMLQFLQFHRIDGFDCTPSQLEMLLSAGLLESTGYQPKRVLIGGEAIGSAMWNRLSQAREIEFFNMYGPTECTVDATICLIRDEGQVPVIGRPIANMKVYLLDKYLHPVPVGVVGEIYIAGEGVARNYWCRPELSAECFVRDPFSNDTTERMYRTGDIGRWTAEGRIEYLGRNDHQVKIRGFRIELGEIENALTSHAQVSDAVVLAKDFAAGDKRLVAYVVTNDVAIQDESETALAARYALIEDLRQHLGLRLPDYMVPTAYVLLASLPLNPNGKIDRKALPEPDVSQQQAAYVAPATTTEKLLCTIWEQILGVERVGTNDNFFQLGGHSLLVMHVIARLQQSGVSIAARQLFKTSTLFELAALIDSTVESTSVFQAPPNRIPDHCMQIVPNMLPLVTLSADEIERIVAQVPGGAANVQDIYPLASLQEGILFHHMLSAKGDPYAQPVLLGMSGREAVEQFIDAFQFVIDRHDVLRTAILWNDLSVPVQVVHRQAKLPVTWLELDPGQDVQAHMLALCAPAMQRIDLCRAPLLRLQIAVNRVSGQHFVLLQFHHLIVDHITLDLILQELELYRSGNVGNLPPSLPYREFVAYEQRHVQGNDAEAFFSQLLGDVEEPTAPFNLLDVQSDGSRIVELKEGIPADMARDLREIARNLGVSPAVLFHAAWAMVISACSGRDDVVFGTVMSGRLQGLVGAEHMLGMFINTLPLRVKLGGVSALALVRQVHAALMDLLPYEQAPLALVQRCSGMQGGAPLFTAMLNYRHSFSSGPGQDGDTQNHSWFEYLSWQERTNYPVNLSVDDTGTGFVLDLQVDAAVDSQRLLSYMQEALAALTKALVATPDIALCKLSVLPQSERDQLLSIAVEGDKAGIVTHERLLHSRVLDQICANGDRIAIKTAARTLSYRELGALSKKLAIRLLEQGARSNTLVGVVMAKGWEQVVAVLGILRSGAAYLPIDANLPEERIALLLKLGEVSQLVTTSNYTAKLPLDPGLAVIEVNADFERIDDASCHLDESDDRCGVNDLAYVIFTSGTTGAPKGVMIDHKGAANTVDDMCARFGVGPHDAVLGLSNLNFDLSVFDIFGLLAVGGKLVLPMDEEVNDPGAWLAYVQDEGITVWNTVPAFMQILVQQAFSADLRLPLRLILMSGDWIPSDLPAKIAEKFPAARQISLGGATEASIWSISYPIDDVLVERKSIPYGKALTNQHMYVLQGDLNPVPYGVSGDIYIGGIGLSLGYWRDQKRTAASFITHPCSGARLYKTGDMGCVRLDGNIEFRGRIDHQVKIRGFRIELGEIENALNSHPQVSDALVLAKDSAAGDKRLVAYVVMVASNDASLATQDQSETAIAARHALIEGLRQHLGLRLPEYMVPAAYVLLASLPLTPNGKVDRKALPEPDASQQQTAWVAPRSDLEQRLCELWQEVLELERVGISDNFFRLGGHSLSATRLVARINQAFKVALPLRVLFQSPTLEVLAQAVAQLDTGLYLPPLQSVSRDVALLPSYAQQRLWLLDRIDGGSAHYNMPAALKLDGALNQDALNLAFTTILARHQSLRTCFTDSGDGQPLQVIQAAAPFAIAVTDLTEYADGERRIKLAELLADEASQVFDLSCDLMLRARLLRMADDEHVLLATMHHIASDGWSMAILINEFSVLYQAYVLGQSNPLPPLAIQYADYAWWQRNWLQGEVLAQQLDYWSGQLANLPVVHSLPLDHARPALQSFAGDMHMSQIDAATSGALHALCQASGATLFMGLHAAFSVLLARYSNETDIVVGSPIANREQAEVAGLIGFFVNTLILRCDLSGNPDFTALLGRSKAMLLDAYAHQQVPFEQIVERLQPERSLSHSPLFQVMLVLQNNEAGRLELPGLTLSPVEPAGSVAKYDLTLIISESAQGLSLGWQYNTDLFEAATIARMAQHFSILLKALTCKPQASVLGADMLCDAERHQLLVEWNDTATDYPRAQCIHELFEAQAAQTPDALALVYEGAQLSYAELNAKANQLAHYLVTEKLVKPDTLVGICVERSLEMVIGILAILKAGGAYVPLDPDYPPARLEYMLGDANLTTVLTQRHVQGRTPISDLQALCMDDARVLAQLSVQPVTNFAAASLALQSSHLAYVIYTSGSTGNPKGVMVEHHSVLNLAFNIQRLDLTTVGQQWGWFASYAFDASIQGLTQLLLGRPLHIISGQRKRDPSLLAELLNTLHVIDCTPMMVEAWLAAGLGHRLPNLIIGGEPISLKLWAQLEAWQATYHKKAINVYGPTECTVDATACLIGGELPHIGKILANTNAYVLNQAAMPSGLGVVGELHLGGVGLARGYLNRPELTNEKFIANPFHDASDPVLSLSSERLYKTGDLVRWLPDGSLEYMGRIDHQVKIRGFRIELGEIENALTSHAQVSDAVVLVKDFAAGDKRLVAYVVTAVTVVSNDASLATQDQSEAAIAARHALIEGLRQHLGSSLPDYMVPTAYVLLASLPLTPNGKIDRKALPEPDASQQQVAWVAPRNEVEKMLCALWQEVLGLERVGITDNFFRLGGHSLSATRLVARINQAFKVVLPLRAVFQAPTLEALAQAVAQLDAGMSLPPLQSVPRDLALPPSYAQQRLWLLDRIDGGSAHYNMPAALRLDGVLNQAALNQAFTSIIARHESLRTCFTEGGDGQPLQVIQAAAPFAIALTDLSAFADGERQLKLTELLAEEASLGFDLSRDLMLRARLLKMAADEHILLATMHHIASDGWSMAILVNEFSALYQAYVLGQPDPLPPLVIQYADYAHWQRNWLQGDVLEQQFGYWTTQLANLPVVHSLPLDYARPAMQSFAGDMHMSQIDATTSGALNALCQTSGATLFMGLHAVFSVLLARYSNETDIVVGSPIANREQAEVADLIGFFVNTLVLRSDLSGNPSFAGLLGRSKDMLLKAYAHQQVPFEQVVERLQPARSLSHSPLFQIMLVLQNNEDGRLELPGLTLSPVAQAGAVAKYDLLLNISESAQGLSLGWEYNTALFEAATIARMAQHFGILLKALVSKPQASVFGIDMLSDAERHQLLVEWNDTATDYPHDQCIHQLFEAQAAQNPDAVAVVFEGKQLSYGELNAKANQLAHYLVVEKQVKPDTLVGICIERSLEMVIGILGILKAGGAYVPLDPDYPPARLEYMLADANLTTVLTQCHLLERTPVSAAQALCLDDADMQQLLATLPAHSMSVQARGLHARHLAYLIYTSGSTGNPKGVMVEHRALLNRIDWMDRHYGSSPSDRILQKTPFSFDVSVWEFVWPLSVGARIVLAKPEGHKDPLYLTELIRAQQITKLHFVPSMLGSMLALGDLSQCSSLRQVFCSGEALALHHVEQFQACCPFAELHNLYGPTEAAIDVSYQDCSQLSADLGSVPIGRPIHNIQLYVMNPQLVPQGVAGELHIGGVGLARGYLNRPELADEKFIANPFHDASDPSSSERLYRTGDLVRWLSDGSLEYLGRIDHQVKIRGFRIELGEIENALSSHPRVSDAVVLARDSKVGDKRLVAYVVMNDTDFNEQDGSEKALATRQALIEGLRQHLGSSLPDYMVPAAFVLLASLPVTPNGKVDRKALPEPDVSQQQATWVAPRTETEKMLCALWQEVLGLERVGITDNFFQLGGHSLLAMKLLTELKAGIGVDIPIKAIFQFSDLQGLSAYLDVINPIPSSRNQENDGRETEEEMEAFQL